MARQIGFSRVFPTYHPKAGQQTHFVEKMLLSLGINFNSLDYFQWLQNNNPKRSHDEIYAFIESLSPTITSEKFHTIRNGKKRKRFDVFSPYVWMDKPYHSGQIRFAPELSIKNLWDFKITKDGTAFIDGFVAGKTDDRSIVRVAENDGLTKEDFSSWFMPKPQQFTGFDGQIICWSSAIKY